MLMSAELEEGINIKTVLVGDGSVGKTSLLISYTTDIFPQDYVPTIFDNYLATIKYNDFHIKLWLWYSQYYLGTLPDKKNTNDSEHSLSPTPMSFSYASH